MLAQISQNCQGKNFLKLRCNFRTTIFCFRQVFANKAFANTRLTGKCVRVKSFQQHIIDISITVKPRFEGKVHGVVVHAKNKFRHFWHQKGWLLSLFKALNMAAVDLYIFRCPADLIHASFKPVPAAGEYIEY